VRTSGPLPAVRPVLACSSRLTSRIASAAGPAAPAGLAEPLARLDTDVGWLVGVPAQEARRDLLQSLFRAQIGAGCRHLCDADRHLGVVAPLARGEVAEPAAQQLGLADPACRAELVRDAESVTGRESDERADGSVDCSVSGSIALSPLVVGLAVALRGRR
jgi:hypothetical protein